MSNQEEKRPFKIVFEFYMKYKPDKGEIRSVFNDLETSLKKNLLPLVPWKPKIKVECHCGFLTEVNPINNKKENWYCRNCGSVILYDILG